MAETLSIREAAEQLRLNPETVRQFIREGRLQASRASGGARAPWRVLSADVERVRAGRDVEGAPGAAASTRELLEQVVEELRGIRQALEAGPPLMGQVRDRANGVGMARF